MAMDIGPFCRYVEYYGDIIEQSFFSRVTSLYAKTTIVTFRWTRMKKLVKGNLTLKHQFFLGLMFAVPLLIAFGKCQLFGCAQFFQNFSLVHAGSGIESRLQYILFIPLGAVIVVFVRLVLGIRLLGPFRSILLAVAFQITGIWAGCIFLAGVIAVVTAIRPVLKSICLPYFARVSVLLSMVASIMIAVFLAGRWLDIGSLDRMIFFPIFALCFTGEGFARTLSKEGAVSAFWRGGFTVLVAIGITFIAQIQQLQDILLNYPELLVLQTGVIILIAEAFDLRLFQWVNPPARKTKSSDKATENKQIEQLFQFSLLEP